MVLFWISMMNWLVLLKSGGAMWRDMNKEVSGSSTSQALMAEGHSGDLQEEDPTHQMPCATVSKFCEPLLVELPRQRGIAVGVLSPCCPTVSLSQLSEVVFQVGEW